MCYRLIDENTARHDVSLMAWLLGVSRQGCYAWKRRGSSLRQAQDAVLTEKFKAHHERSHGTYGAPRMRAPTCGDLRPAGRPQTRGPPDARSRLARGTPARWPGIADRQDRRATAAPDLIGRNFTVMAPNLLWTADITYVPTDQGWLYLAVVLDLFSRRIVGWAMADHLRTELATEALAMAIAARRPVRAWFIKRQGLAVHEFDVRPALRRGGHPAFHRPDRLVFRECRHREFLTGNRTHRPHHLPHPSPRRAGPVRLRRRLL
jgi:putative transposase